MDSVSWLDVDREGLAKTLARRGGDDGGGGIVGVAWLLFELWQNAADTAASEITMTLTPIANKPYCTVVVKDDDYDGFKNLSHAWTLFAESEKKGDPEKRGRFNVGEKLVLALCEEATIASTSGTVTFDKTGRHVSKKKTEIGSVFTATVRMTRAEYEQACKAVQLLIVPEDKKTTFNGKPLAPRAKQHAFELTLPTEIADAEGVLRRSARKTVVSLHSPREGEVPMIYEMGIPVVELTGGEPWHINVHQKVPLNSDRDNVTPAYLRELRTAVLNKMYPTVKGETEAAQPWVRDAAGDPDATKEAVEHVKTERFGKNTVSYDPSDPEGTKLAHHMGYTVIPGGALSKGEWENIRRDKIVLPAGQVTPSKPEGFAESTLLDGDKRTPGMVALGKLVVRLGQVLGAGEVKVRFVESPEATVHAQFGGGTMTFNVSQLGRPWFEHGVTEEQVDLILHELGHKWVSDHLSKAYNDALTRLGAKLAFFIAENPTFFKDFGW